MEVRWTCEYALRCGSTFYGSLVVSWTVSDFKDLAKILLKGGNTATYAWC